jgi:hypothetical protein
MAELADALDLGSNEATHAGSIPVGPTSNEKIQDASGFYFTLFAVYYRRKGRFICRL